MTKIDLSNNVVFKNDMLNRELEKRIIKTTGADVIKGVEVIQSLWSGYGQILRVALGGCEVSSVVVKQVQPPAELDHPRGWNNDRSHQRKQHSYAVEMAWYRDWSGKCDEHCRVADVLALFEDGERCTMLLEDLDAAGFDQRKTALELQEVKLCLRWLAHFHGRFMAESPTGLWPQGTYWHLATRPDELVAMADVELQQAAARIDARLRQSAFQTLVHGDAKVANFCFSGASQQVAAVDFQYVGGGCGMKDVIYLLGSCLSEQQCRQWQTPLLDYYFKELKQGLSMAGQDLDCDRLERDWRDLFAYAWTDFYRFLVGWSPGHWKLNDYGQQLKNQVLQQLRTGPVDSFNHE